MDRERLQMASCGKHVIHRVGKVALRRPESGNAILSRLTRRVRRATRPSPRGGSRPRGSGSVEQAGRVEIMGQATLVSPLMDGVRCALLSFEPPIVSV